MGRTDPERRLVRRVIPFVPLALALAFALGWAVRGPDQGWSAALGVGVVVLNFVLFAISLAWAATISPVAMYAVGLGGFVLRLGLFLVALLALDATAWFSPVAFVAAFVPATIALLAFEMRMLADRKTQADFWYFREPTP